MHICPSIEYVERAWDDAKYGRPSTSPLLEMTIPTMYDPSLAPEGKHIMGIFLQYAPYTLKDTTWDEQREPFADRVFDIITEYCPNFRDIVEARQVFRRSISTSGRAITGETISMAKSSIRPDVRNAARGRMGAVPNAVRGLWLCDRALIPAAGSWARPGYNCAREMLKDGSA